MFCQPSEHFLLCCCVAVDVGLWSGRVLLSLPAVYCRGKGAAVAEDPRRVQPPTAAAAGLGSSIQVRAFNLLHVMISHSKSAIEFPHLKLITKKGELEWYTGCLHHAA